MVIMAMMAVMAFAFLWVLLCSLVLLCRCSSFRPPPALGGDLISTGQAEGGKDRGGKCANARANDTAPGRIPAQSADQIVKTFALHGSPRSLICSRSTVTMDRVVTRDVSTSGA